MRKSKGKKAKAECILKEGRRDKDGKEEKRYRLMRRKTMSEGE